ncbi:hypothetical protein [Microbulbifer taiwanensis]|uniref:Uncharacterized protein n=1 Tax=Microbulbifer taiwanensis TaxID=986746 RepID=A0ABW1YVI0_9GAMM|nr:hypothetical protein [Microbulbifer taiwanensis]
MRTVVSIISRSVGADSRHQPQTAECNYADNYYGDQVCVLRSS